MPEVASVAVRDGHGLGKTVTQSITLITGKGVEGDAHLGVTVKHRSRVAKDPAQPNLRQVHLIESELFDELAGKGFSVSPGAMGENITTFGIDLLGLATGTRLGIGADAVVEITGLRNPCHQLNGLAPGLMDAVLARADDGELIRKAGVMAIVIAGGVVSAGDRIRLIEPTRPFAPLMPV